MEGFRFEKLDIWKKAIEVGDKLYDVSEVANDKKFYRFAEQLRAASLSISNNIAEGSGSVSNKEFASFLNIARRSVFECANILYVFQRRELLTESQRLSLYHDLIDLSRRIYYFRQTLL